MIEIAGSFSAPNDSRSTMHVDDMVILIKINPGLPFHGFYRVVRTPLKTLSEQEESYDLREIRELLYLTATHAHWDVEAPPHGMLDDTSHGAAIA